MMLVMFTLIWFLGGLLTGVSSFGGNLFAVPVAALLYPAKVAIVTGCISGAAICIGLAFAYRHHIVWKDVLALAAGSLAGIPPGVWFLKHANERTLLLGCVAAIAIFLITNGILKSHGSVKLVRSAWLALPFGFIAGITTGALSISGLAMCMYAFLVNMPKEKTLATLNTAGAFVMVTGLPFQYMSGLLPLDIAGLGLLGAGASIIGVAVSVPLIRHMNQALFSRVMLATMAASAVILTGRALL